MVVMLAPKAERKSGGGGRGTALSAFQRGSAKSTLITSFFSKE